MFILRDTRPFPESHTLPPGASPCQPAQSSFNSTSLHCDIQYSSPMEGWVLLFQYAHLYTHISHQCHVSSDHVTRACWSVPPSLLLLPLLGVYIAAQPSAEAHGTIIFYSWNFYIFQADNFTLREWELP